MTKLTKLTTKKMTSTHQTSRTVTSRLTIPWAAWGEKTEK